MPIMVAPMETGALERMIRSHRGDLPPEVAREVLSWEFADSDQQRMSELSAKARAGSLTGDEERQLDWYLMLGDFLMILQSMARVALKDNPTVQR
jgi:hypothetical protein